MSSVRKYAYLFGYAIGLVGMWAVITITSPFICAKMCFDAWLNLDIDNVKFVNFRKQKK